MTISAACGASEPGEGNIEKTSATIRRFAAQTEGTDVSLGSVLLALKDRGFGIFMILFALPNAVIPGISFVLGAPVLLFALQLASGRETVWLPDFMSRRTLSPMLFAKIAGRVEKFLLWIEKRSKPRWTWLVSGSGERVLGAYIAVVAGFLMLPVPFGNPLPALGISFMSAGLIEKDGKAAATGMVLGFLGAAYIGVAIAIGFEALKALVGLF